MGSFCKTRGILPFRRPRIPTEAEQTAGETIFTGWAINLRCLDEINTADLPVRTIQGSILPLA